MAVLWRREKLGPDREVAAIIRDYLGWKYIFRRPSIEEILAVRHDSIASKWGIHPNSMHDLVEELESFFKIEMPSELKETHVLCVQSDVTLSELIEMSATKLWKPRHLVSLAKPE